MGASETENPTQLQVFAQSKVQSLHVAVLSPIWDCALELDPSLLETDLLTAFRRTNGPRNLLDNSEFDRKIVAVRPVVGVCSTANALYGSPVLFFLVDSSRNVCGWTRIACERCNNARPLLKVGNPIAWHEHDIAGCDDGILANCLGG